MNQLLQYYIYKNDCYGNKCGNVLDFEETNS